MVSRADASAAVLLLDTHRRDAPGSRGWVRLRSADPRAAPRIQFNMYAAHEDLDTMIRGVRACRDLFSHRPLSEMIEREVAPGRDWTATRTWAR